MFFFSILESFNVIFKIKYCPLKIVLKHYLYIKFTIFHFQNFSLPVSIFIASTFTSTSLSSTPYAPMFCMGAAPTVPGIRAKFSIPQ